MPLSKNVIRSMNTDIKNKLEKALKYREYAEALEAEAKALQEFVANNSQEDGKEQVKISAKTPIEQAIEQPEEAA